MAGKPELSAAPSVQNVVVYVSNDHFAQAYAVNHHAQQQQQNEGMQQRHHHHHQQHHEQASQNGVNTGLPMAFATGPAQSHNVAPLAPKIYPDKLPQHTQQLQLQQQHLHQQQMLESQQQQQQQFNHQTTTGYFTNQAVITHQNGFPHQPSFNTSKDNKGAVAYCEDVAASIQQQQQQQQRTTIKDEYHHHVETPTGYVVMGGEGPATVRSCDSVRSETAESSCSSLSSADDGMLIISNNLPQCADATNMVVYDGSGGGVGTGGNGVASGVNVRHGVVVAVGGGPHATSAVTVSGAPIIAASSGSAGSNQQTSTLLQQQQQQQPMQGIPVPHGWKRLITNGVVIYISPSNTALSSLEHVKDYLQTPGTCKCGLECPLKYDVVFNFDPKIVGKAWTFTPDTNNGDLTKLCNHKRKYVQQLKDCNQLAIKKKKRKLCTPFAGGVSASHQVLAAQRDKINPNATQPLQILQQQSQFATKDNPYQHPPSQGATQVPQLQQPHPQNQHQILAQRTCPPGPGYQLPPQSQQQQQFFGYQSPGSQSEQQKVSSPMVVDHMVLPTTPNQNISSPAHSHHIQLQSNTSQQQQPLRHQIIGPNGQLLIPAGNILAGSNQRVFINGQPSEPSGPGRPVQMIPVSIATTPSIVRPDKLQSFIQNGQIYHTNPSQHPQGIRHFVSNGFRHQLLQQQQHQQQQQKIWSRGNPIPVPVQSPSQSPNAPPVPGTANAYERVPPLHQHQPNQLIQSGQVQVQVQSWQEEIARKKMKTKIKKQRYMDPHHAPCPNIDVRQINDRVVVNQFPNESSSPSFLEDPSGYLAQQTALLNNTINRQTGANNFVCNSPSPAQAPGVPLPSNMKSYRQQTQIVNVKMNNYNQPQVADSALDPNCQNCVVEYPSGITGNANGAGTNEKFSRSGSAPGTPDSVTSSNYVEKHSPDSRPIQGGTVSTSNVSPAIEGDDSGASGASTSGSPAQDSFYVEHQQQQQQQQPPFTNHLNGRGVVTTMASGRTVGSNTITSVLAGRANTATVSISNAPSLGLQQQQQQQVSATRSPLEMVQSVVSSIKLPHSQNQTINLQSIPQQVVQKGLPAGHILVSSGGQLIMASTQAQPQQQQMPPPPPKIQTSMPPISVSPMLTNVTASVTQMIPAVAQQVLGQQTVLVNALPGPFVLQPGVTMTMDGMNQLQIPQLVTGNVIQQQLQQSLLSPENKNKKGKKRKVPTQTVASMLQIAAQQNSGVVSFPQQIQMHSPQGLTATPVMQALTIVPGKAGAPPQIVMNGQQIINSQSQPINLLQPVNLAQGMVQNFPTIQQFVLPTNLAGMVMNADGTATIVQDANIGMQLQLQNVNGQNVLTPVQNNQMFTTVGANGQSIIPSGMVIRPQGKLIQQQHSPGAQFLSPTGGGQFVAQFNGQLSPLVASVSPGQQVTFSPQIRPSNVQQPVQQQEYIQCGQTLMVPANIAVSQASNQQNTTYVQQNTTIVQQQTTMLSNQSSNGSGQMQQQNLGQHPGQHQHVQQNLEQQSFIIADKHQQSQQLQQQQNIQTVLLHQRQQQQQQQQQQHQQQQLQLQQQQINYRNSVSTQTAVNGQSGQSVTTFCQTNTSQTSAGSPPDTTTLSPLASGGQSPPTTADTTTHTGGSTDDGLSPAPSNCSDVNVNNLRHSSMAMVHCVSSSEPDSAEPNQDFDATLWRNVVKSEFTDINALNHSNLKKTTPTRVAYAESSTMMHFVSDAMHQMHKQQERVVSTRNFEKPKRKHSDTLIVMETRHSHSLYDDDDDIEKRKSATQAQKVFVDGDLVWGPAKGCPAWPGKLMHVKDDVVTVRWFGGGDKTLSDVHPTVLQTLSEGLDAHHRASKKSRTGRKLNAQLEKAIQEAMIELDKITSIKGHKVEADAKVQVSAGDTLMKKPENEKKTKTSGRLRSSRQS